MRKSLRHPTMAGWKTVKSGRARRDEGDRELFAIRREERELVAEERELERGLEALEEDEHRVERQIDAEWRKEHWGHEPEHPPSWADNGERRPPGESGDA